MKIVDYIPLILQVLGALYVLCTLLGRLPGKAGALFSALAGDLEKLRAVFPPSKPSEAPKVPPLPLLLVLLVPLVGCAWLSKPSHYADMARILSCISAEAAAGKSAGEIALTCGLENADAVIDLVTKSQGVASAAPKMAKPAAAAGGGK